MDIYEAVALQMGRGGAAALTDAEKARIDLLVGDAEGEISRRISPSTLASLDQQALARVVREAVAERMLQPVGIRSQSVQTDDATISTTYGSVTGAELVHDPWWSWLGMVDTPSGSRSFSITPSYVRGGRCF